MKTVKMYVVRLTGKEVTLIVAALVQSKLSGAKGLAARIVTRLMK